MAEARVDTGKVRYPKQTTALARIARASARAQDALGTMGSWRDRVDRRHPIRDWMLRHRRALEFRPRPLPGRSAPPSRFERVLRAAVRQPLTLLAASLTFIALGWGVVSCQSPARTTAASVPLAPREHKLNLTSEPEVRVRVRASAGNVKVSGPSAVALTALGSTGPAGPRVMLATPLKIEGTQSGLRVSDLKGVSQEFPGPAGVQIAADGNDARQLRVDNIVHPGVLRVIPRATPVERPVEKVVAAPKSDVPSSTLASPGGEPGSAAILAELDPPKKKAPAPAARPATKPAMKIDVIEYLPIETYLVGVVPSEMFADWPLAAYQVQAVCARTYALHERQRSIDLNQDFDLESTTTDQAYNGGSTNATAQRAVETTRGVVMTWEGQLIRAYYSSTCGGRNASAADVFSTKPGYEFNRAAPLQAHARDSACQGSKWYRWEVTRDRLQLSAQIRQWGVKNGHEVQRIGVIESIEAERLNADGRPSIYRLTDEKGRTWDLSAESVRVACNVAAPGAPDVTNTSRVRSGDVEFIVEGPKVVIRGRGFGHGVGMCQYCAKAFADRGMDWKKQLELFYPRALLERAY